MKDRTNLQTQNTGLAPLWIVLASALWAIDTLIRYPLMGKGIPAYWIVFVEQWGLCFLVGLILLLFSRDSEKIHISRSSEIFEFFHRCKKKRILFSFIFIGMIGSSLSTIAFTYSFSQINPSIVILLQKWQPIVALIGARFLLKEHIGPSILFALLPCLLGSFLLSFPNIEEWQRINLLSSLNPDNIKAILACVFSIIGWGGSTVAGRYLVNQKIEMTQLVWGRFFFASCVFIPAILIMPQQFFAPLQLIGQSIGHQVFWSSMLVMIILSGLLGMTAYYKGLRHTPARLATLLELTFPLFAVLSNAIWLKQGLSSLQILGGGLLILGALIAQWRRN